MKLSYKVGISTKLIAVVSLLIVSAIGAVVYIASDLYLEESTNRIQVNNKDAVMHASQKIQNDLEDVVQQMKIMATVLKDNGLQSEESANTVYRILSGFDNFLSFSIYKNVEGKLSPAFTSVLPTAISEFDLSEEQLIQLVDKNITAEQIGNHILILNSAKVLKRPIITLFFKSIDTNTKQTWYFRSDLRQSLLLQALPENKEIISYVVDGKGNVYSHSQKSERYKINQGLTYQDKMIVRHLAHSKLSNHLLEFVDGKQEYLGAYRKVNIGDLHVVAQVAKKKALATIEQVQYRSLLVMIIVVCFAFFINVIFSESLTQPLRNLYSATESIVDGKFDIKLKRSSSDELGALTDAFNGMAVGLKEREKIKSAFNKFHSKEVAKKLLSGEIKLGGERKQVTILFSDIRGFTALSESMSPDQVVQLLNEYLSGMVQIIFKWKGVVDKFIGDAIMAVWGAPESDPDDAYHSIRAALEMRDFMFKWNAKREAAGKTSFAIGIGIHSGEVLAGNIGSDERLEYTCIGDSVNQSSRIEASTKVLNTDILISSSTYNLVQEKGIVCGPVVEINAKGKSEPIKVHQVIGYEDEDGKIITSLSNDRINEIKNANLENLNFDEEKTSIVGADDIESLSKGEEETGEYFVVTNTEGNESEGPYTLEKVKLKMAQGHFDIQTAYIYKQGDEEMIPLSQFEGVNRRNKVSSEIAAPPVPEVVKQTAFINEWYISGPKGEPVGPYSLEELIQSVEKGQIQRTTYVWKAGMEDWQHLYQIPGFDRRSIA